MLGQFLERMRAVEKVLSKEGWPRPCRGRGGKWRGKRVAVELESLSV